ncbi:class I SAM-dependent methyltransferase [Denitromonas iodatirespirans]|uniref:Class I SAM-dependent methyltransferase n=1 Tax=Denitromonas iodatirespirans TaxID=2795389 RepID=A0A944H8R0_DENI1|nr:class I SAM-dependent methyltransferase [Denitromonas iodatirespirans]MBT0962588.1 class I SAM-dependent methyltransferase [Denitromonas iodatirespirans]
MSERRDDGAAAMVLREGAMRPAQTAVAYDRIAGHWDCPAFDGSDGIAQHERALRFLARPGTALDIGCGSSGRIMGLLLSRGFVAEGLDLSQEMLRRARKHHPAQRFYHADVCEWTFPTRYDFISAWDSLWHVPLHQQLQVLHKICDGLVPGGVLIFTTGGVEQADEVTNPCFGEPLYHAAPGIPALLRTLDAAGCACRHLEYDQHPANHVFVIAQRRSALDRPEA